MILTRRQRDWLVREATRRLPREACGVLVGRRTGGEAGGRDTVTDLFRSVNLAPDPMRRFRIDPVLLGRLSRRLRASKHEILGYYHSHPRGGAEPSTRDLFLAWPGARYLILSVRGGRVDEIRCWTLEGHREGGGSGRLRELEWTLAS